MIKPERIATYKLRKRSRWLHELTMPRRFVEQNNLVEGDEVDVYITLKGELILEKRP